MTLVSTKVYVVTVTKTAQERFLEVEGTQVFTDKSRAETYYNELTEDAGEVLSSFEGYGTKSKTLKGSFFVYNVNLSEHPILVKGDDYHDYRGTVHPNCGGILSTDTLHYYE